MTAPLYSGEIDPGPAEQPLDELQTPLSARFTASLGSDLSGLPTIQARRAEDVSAAEAGLKINDWLPGLLAPSVEYAPTPEIPIEEAKQRVAGSGLTGRLTLPDGPTIREGALDLMINNARTESEREDRVRRGPQGFTPSALDAGTSFLVGAVDPLNVAAFSIPVLGEARFGYLAERAGSSLLARAAVRGGYGAVQGRSPARRWLRSTGRRIRRRAKITRFPMLCRGSSRRPGPAPRSTTSICLVARSSRTSTGRCAGGR